MEFKLEPKNDFEISPPYCFRNCVTKPYVILLCYWLKKMTTYFAAVDYTFVQKELKNSNEYLIR